LALVAGFLFLSPAAWAPVRESVRAAKAETLAGAMAATGATADRFTVSTWTRLPAPEPDDAELEGVVTAAMASLGYQPGRYALRRAFSERHRLVKAELAEKGLYIVATAQVIYPVWDKGSPEAYLAINVENTAKPSEIAGWRVRLAGAGAAGGGGPRITTCLVGWLDGKLEHDERYKKLHDAGQALGAEVIDTVAEANFASVTAFSPGLPDSLVIGGRRVNVNMAVRYSPAENRTYIIIASPIITGEY